MITDDKIELLKQIDQLAEQFESDWKSGGSVDFVKHLDQIRGDGRAEYFESILAVELDYRSRRDMSLDKTHWHTQYPEFAEIVEKAFADMIARQPRRIGPYELREKLGQGGMGAVYKAWHSRLRRYVAIKLLPSETADNPELLARFDREMQAVGKLSHPNVVTASDADFRDGVHFLAMEYCDGMDLSEVIARVGTISVADACEIICQAAQGLQHAHQHGLLHRDIKPSNLMLCRDGTVRILDMGLARLNTTDARELTSTGQIMGTFDYMSPEQASSSDSIDVRSDIYSLGMTLYKLLTGILPYAPPKYDTAIKKLVARTSVPAASIRKFRSGLPVDVVQACDKTLMINPEQRFSEPKDLRAALLPFCEDADLISLIDNAQEVTYANDPMTGSDQSTVAHAMAAEVDTISHHDSGVSFDLNLPAVGKELAAHTISQTIIESNKKQTVSRSVAVVAGRSTTPPKQRVDFKKKWLFRGIAGSLMCAVIGVWASGVFSIKTSDGTLEINSIGNAFLTSIQGKNVKIQNAETGEAYSIDLNTPSERKTIAPGSYIVLNSSSGLATQTNHFTIRSGKTESIEVTWKGNDPMSELPTPTPSISPSGSFENSSRSKRNIAAVLVEEGALATFLHDRQIIYCDQVSEIPTDPADQLYGIMFDANFGQLTAANLAPLANLGSDYQLSIEVDVDLNTMRQLTQLPLDYLHITLANAGSDELKQLTKMKSLRCLSTNHMTKEQLRNLQPLAPQLERLGFYTAGMRDEDLVELGMFHQLRELQLGRNYDLTDAVIPYLLPLRSLQALDLFGANLTDAGILELKEMTNLLKLNLAETQCTAEGVQELRQRLPKCNIVFSKENSANDSQTDVSAE